VSEAGLQELLERVGQDLRRLMGELDKLEAFAEGSHAPLSAEQVAAVLGRGLARPLYKLGDALMERRAGMVLDLMEEALEEGEAPLKILAVLHRALRQVRGARALSGGRTSREDVVSRLGVLPFKAGDVLAAARRWSEPQLRSAMVAFDRADRRIKSGTEGRLALVAAVAEACGSGPGPIRPASRPVR
jgi:DNA polymerase-3 subunit delta